MVKCFIFCFPDTDSKEVALDEKKEEHWISEQVFGDNEKENLKKEHATQLKVDGYG